MTQCPPSPCTIIKKEYLLQENIYLKILLFIYYYSAKCKKEWIKQGPEGNK
jgi:hypothetical protein